MTANVAQQIANARAWEEWNRDASHRVTELPGVGAVETWVQLVEVSGSLVSFRWTYVFAADGQVLTSDSTLRFREREEVEADLVARGFVVDEVHGAPDRPGREFVFIARRPARLGATRHALPAGAVFSGGWPAARQSIKLRFRHTDPSAVHRKAITP